MEAITAADLECVESLLPNHALGIVTSAENPKLSTFTAREGLTLRKKYTERVCKHTLFKSYNRNGTFS